MIAILSDFGHSEYLGIMKGVIKKQYPEAKIIDLYHNVSPHSILEGAWVLLQSYVHFPKGTVFLCVVDPGVGGTRNPVAVKTKNYFFVGPDNGLLYPAASENKIVKIVKLSDKGASKTFHGRDIFAGAAARIAQGEKFESLGKSAALKEKLQLKPRGREGLVVRIDHFGNIITNLKHLRKKSYEVMHDEEQKELPYADTYEAAPEGELFVITGSSGTLEISFRNGAAADKFAVKVGDRVTIK